MFLSQSRRVFSNVKRSKIFMENANFSLFSKTWKLRSASIFMSQQVEQLQPIYKRQGKLSQFPEQLATRTFSTETAKCENQLQPLSISRLAFIGAGNMAEAIVSGLLEMKVITSDKIIMSAPDIRCRERYKKYNVTTTMKNSIAAENADIIVIAVKPQVLSVVLESILSTFNPKKSLILSIVAGSPIKLYEEYLGKDACIIRTMPNTGAIVGEGVTVWAQNSNVTEEQHEECKRMLESFGIQVFVSDEKNLSMATALSGSGPAYFFLVAEAMVDAGVHMGFTREVATALVQQTMIGSAIYMKESGLHPTILRNKITSPGGTTAAALYRAEKSGFRAVIADSIWAAYERSIELGQLQDKEKEKKDEH